MAANYWISTQREHWTYTRPLLNEARRRLEEDEAKLVQQFQLPDRRHISIFFYNQLKKRASYKPQALATALVYMKRFYTKVEIRRTNPFLVAITALYLACKIEETPQHIRVMLGEAHNAWPEAIHSDTSKIGECEFTLISEMNSQLIVHHPYRTLSDLQSEFSLDRDETSTALSIINDHYLTDLPLLHPPHVIAVAAVFLAVVIRPTQSSLHVHSAAGFANALHSLNSGGSMGNMHAAAASAAAQGPTPPPNAQAQAKVQKVVAWLSESTVDVEAVVECVQEMISLYEVWEQYNEKAVRDSLVRLVKSRGLDK